MSIKKIVKPFQLLLLISICCCLPSQAASAAKNNKVADGIGFTYENIVPENQISEGTFFDLKVKPGQKQILKTKLINTSNQAITVKISLNDAKTTETGLIQYGSARQLKNSANFKQKLSDYITVPKKVHLKKGQSKIVKLHLTMPKEPIKGELLAGIELEKVSDTKEPKGKFAVKNQYAYTYSISVRTDDEKLPLKFIHKPSKYLHEENEGVVQTSFANEQPMIVREMSVENTVVSDETGKEVTSRKQENMKMAPCSIIAISLPMEDIKEGKYTVTTTVKVGDQDWKWTDKVIVPKTDPVEEQKNVTETKQTKKSKGPLLFVVMVLVIVVGTGLVYFVIRQSRK